MARSPKSSRWLTYLEAISYVCTPLALIGLFLQMNADSAAKRTEMSLALVQQFNSEPISSHRLNLQLAWFPHRAELAAINSHGGLSPVDREKFVDDVLAQAGTASRPPLSLSVIELAAFFDRVVLCVEVHTCNRSIVDPYFRELMRSFWTNYRHIVVAARITESPNLAAPLERYLNGRSR